LGENFSGILNSDCYNACNWLDVAQRQLCWAHLKREFAKISERQGASRQLGRDTPWLNRKSYFASGSECEMELSTVASFRRC